MGATHVTLPVLRGDTIHDAVHAFGVTYLAAAPTVLSLITDPATARCTPRTVRGRQRGVPHTHARLPT